MTHLAIVFPGMDHGFGIETGDVLTDLDAMRRVTAAVLDFVA